MNPTGTHAAGGQAEIGELLRQQAGITTAQWQLALAQAGERERASVENMLKLLSKQRAAWYRGTDFLPCLTAYQVRGIIARLNEEESPPLLRLKDYLLLESLGKGGMGEVFKGVDLRAAEDGNDRARGLRSIKRNLYRHSRRMLLRESSALELLAGRSEVPRIHGHFTLDGHDCLVLEFIPGLNLKKLVRERGALSLASAIPIGVELFELLDEMDRLGVFHRDIKPQNLIIEDAGGELHGRLIDFGLAKLTGPEQDEEQDLTGEGDRIGTFEYYSPEHCTRLATINSASDVYCVAQTLFFALVGEPPFPCKEIQHAIAAHLAEPPPRLLEKAPALAKENAEVAAELDELIQRALAKKPHERPAARVMADSLRRLQVRLLVPSFALPATPAPPERRPVAVPPPPAGSVPIRKPTSTTIGPKAVAAVRPTVSDPHESVISEVIPASRAGGARSDSGSAKPNSKARSAEGASGSDASTPAAGPAGSTESARKSDSLLRRNLVGGPNDSSPKVDQRRVFPRFVEGWLGGRGRVTEDRIRRVALVRERYLAQSVMPKERRRAEELVAEATGAVSLKDWERAARLYREACRIRPFDWDSRRKLHQAAEKALDEDPRRVDWLSKLWPSRGLRPCFQLWRDGAIAEALDRSELALIRNPWSFPAVMLQAALFDVLEDWQACKESVRKAVRLRPSVSLDELTFKIDRYRGDEAGALASLHRLRGQHPERAAVYDDWLRELKGEDLPGAPPVKPGGVA
jgi:serine/threonine protein kinase